MRSNTQTTAKTATAEHLLGLLSRSRPRPATGENTINSSVIRLSQLRAERGPAVAVMKIARNQRGATELRTQRRLVAEIASQPGLDKAWRDLLPRVLSFDERADATVCVESYRPGTFLAEVLAEHPDRFEALAAQALEAIAPLHRATSRSIVVDHLSSVRKWVVDPVIDLAGRLDHALTPELEQLEATLTRAIVGRRMTVCWTHGAYTPDCVQLAGPRGPVNRIEGWDRARGDRPALIDTYLLILTASAQVEDVDLCAVVSARLSAGGLSNSERDVLKAMNGRLEEPETVDERVAILLAWLHHTAAQCRVAAEPSQLDVALDAQVAQVLGAVAKWLGFEPPAGATAADAS